MMRLQHIYLAAICLFKINNGNTRTLGEICLKLTIIWCLHNFEQILHFALVGFFVDSEQVNNGWVLRQISPPVSYDQFVLLKHDEI